MGRKLMTVAVPVGLAVGLLGCGSSSSDLKPELTSGEQPPPKQMLGAYAATVPKKKLAPQSPPELKRAGTHWRLEVESRGGPRKTPALAILKPTGGTLESSRLGVEGSDTLILHDEPCGPSHGTVDSLYHFKMTGKKLKIVKFRNGCSDKVAEAILTARPWVKQHR